MKNVIFISPNFPQNYWLFCRALRDKGANVLGIGDAPYDELLPQLREALTEYYRVDSLENYDQVYRAVAFFIFKYGRVDFLESNNEYWLQQDARLRTDFNIPGFHNDDIPRIRFKSGMKAHYLWAGIPVARYHLVDDKIGCLSFLAEVGWPVVVKPDNGVGAAATYKLRCEADLDRFLKEWDRSVPSIMEEFIQGQVETYDAIYNSRGEPLFEAGNVSPISIMDIVNDNGNCAFYIRKEVPEDIRTAGRAAAKAFGVRSRFIHFEFFRLSRDQHIGKKGDVVALEVNMRPSGGVSPDMMNYARSTDVYRIWADMVVDDRTDLASSHPCYCAYAGRRDGLTFRLSHEELLARWGDRLRQEGRVPDALSGAMGNYMYLCVCEDREQLDAFYRDALDSVGPENTAIPVV